MIAYIMLLSYEAKRQIMCQNIALEAKNGVISIVTEELGRKQVTLDPKSAGIKIDVELAKVATSSFQRMFLSTEYIHEASC